MDASAESTLALNVISAAVTFNVVSLASFTAPPKVCAPFVVTLLANVAVPVTVSAEAPAEFVI